jgi:CRP-like cAMP-binding protein
MSGPARSASVRDPTWLRRTLRECPRFRLAPRAQLLADALREVRLLFVEQGVVLLARTSASSSRPTVLAVLGAGVVLPPLAADEYLVALVDAVVTAVSPNACRALLADPKIAGALVGALVDALHERQETLATVTGGVHAERLRGKLIQLAREHGKVRPDGVHIPLPLTHELLGQMVGAARETVSATVAQLQREGFLARKDGRYRLNATTCGLLPDVSLPQAVDCGERRA